MSLGDFLASLINDPTQPGGGWLANLLGSSPTASTSTPTLASPPVGQGTSSTNPATPNSPSQVSAPNMGPQNLMQFFRPRTGLLGNSILGDAIRGGFNGLNASTGYTGSSAWGAGFAGAQQAARERAQSQMGTALAGQQFQQGQQGIAQNNLQMAQAIRNYNLWNQFANPGAPPVTYNDLSDPQKLAQIMSAPPNAGLAGAPGASSAAPSSGGQPTQQSAQIPLQAYYQAFQRNEGSGQNAVSPKGAAGVYQIMPGTFQQYARPGESFSNERDRETVAQRYIQDLYSKYGQDPHAMAAAYFAGSPNAPGNASDGNMTVDQYAQNLQQNLGLSGGNPGPQDQSGQQPGDDLVAAFAQTHMGMTPQRYAELGMQMHDPNMIAEAEKYNPALITGVERAKTQGGVTAVRPGGALLNNSTGEMIGNGNPVRMSVMMNGQEVPALQYPDGHIVVSRFGGQGGNDQGGASAAGQGNGNNSAGGAPVEGYGPYTQERMKGYAEKMTNWGNGIQSGMIAEQRMNAIADALTKTQAGAWATDKADVAAGLKAVGLGDLANTLLPNTDVAAVQTALKDNFSAAIEQVKQFTSRPAVAELTQAQKNLANPNLQPGANRAILGQVVGTLQWNRDMYEAAQPILDKNPGDPDKFAIDWNKSHPIGDYIKKATDAIPQMAGEGASTGTQTATSTTGPKPGSVQTYGGQKWKFNGGDPKVPDNWTLVP